jgi:hypothetical protein
VEYVKQRHDNVALLLVALCLPTWGYLPFFATVWGYAGGWRPLYWAPCLAAYVAAQTAGVTCLYYEPEAWLRSRVGVGCALSLLVSGSVMTVAPLVMQLQCATCIPLHDLLAFTSAVALLVLMQVR